MGLRGDSVEMSSLQHRWHLSSCWRLQVTEGSWMR